MSESAGCHVLAQVRGMYMRVFYIFGIQLIDPEGLAVWGLARH